MGVNSAYYNENDPFAVAWLRELIKAGHITPGEVDERSIEDVEAADLEGFTRCHFFAGIAGWEQALALAGWADRPVWTGSCPCQPFSVAGKGLGVEDERHLWPVWHELIRECRPPDVFGEQVASADGRAWLDSVRLDLEDVGYAVGAADLCAAGVGAPQIRQRLWWVASAVDPGLEGWQSGDGHACQELAAVERDRSIGGPGRGPQEQARGPGVPGGVGSADSGGARGNGRTGSSQEAQGEGSRRVDRGGGDTAGASSPWSECDWIPCDDPKGVIWRPVEPGTFPLAARVPGDVGRLRGYGNSIVPQAAAEFVMAFMEC